MTKYYQEQNRIEKMRQQKADLPISISSERFEREDKPKVYCPECQFDTVIKEEFNYRCTRTSCGHIFDFEQENIRTGTKSKLSVRGSRDKQSLVAYPPDANDAYYGDSKPQYQGTFKAMADRGIHITSYTESDGSGKVTQSYSESSIAVRIRSVRVLHYHSRKVQIRSRSHRR